MNGYCSYQAKPRINYYEVFIKKKQQIFLHQNITQFNYSSHKFYREIHNSIFKY